MTAPNEHSSEALPLEGTMLGIDGSSWVSWASYYIGFLLAASPERNAALSHFSWQAGTLIGAIAAFFIAIVFIQRHMKFSLMANTYGSPNHLVSDGVFAYSRNPIYVAFFMPLMSLAVLSPLAALAALCLYIAGLNHLVIKREERVLEAAFGDDYRAYKSRVRRWL